MASSDRDESKFPIQGLTRDYWSNETEATATCFCGAVQMVVPLTAPGLVNTFVCHCSDCRKVSASMFATNFTTLDTHTRFTRGEDNLTVFGQSTTTTTGNTMSNSFCKTCGTLMFRAGSGAPGTRFMRGGMIDDHTIHGTLLRPEVEIFSEHRVSWLDGLEGVKQNIGMGDLGK
ncbi:hypothetical protein IAU60_005836 [Kwoniella sp. DSM 27419]